MPNSDEAPINEELLEAYALVQRLVSHADKMDLSAPMWYGWALREAFLAGIQWERARVRKLPRREL